MELGGGREHFSLGPLPQESSYLGQLLGRFHDLSTETTLGTEMPAHNGTIDHIQRSNRRECDIKLVEMSLQASRNVIPSTSGMVHGSHESQIHNGRKLSRFIQRIHTRIFNDLPNNFIGHLITPVIDFGHVQIIDKDNHFSSSRGTIGGTHSLLHARLDRLLVDTRRCGR